jgi:hypothetical protein
MLSKINFNKERDFSAVFSDTLLFIKQNFKPLFSSILFIAGPFLLVSGSAIGYLQSGGIYKGGFMRGGSLDVSNVFLIVGVIFFSALIGSMVLYCVVFNYMILYNKKPEGETITVSEVGQQVLKTIWRTLGSFLMIVLITVVIAVILVLAAVGISAALAEFGAVIMGLVLIAAVLIYGPVLSYLYQATFFVVLRDESTAMSSMSKVWFYTKGNFWWTWLIMVVAVISLYIINMVFALPATIYGAMNTFSRIRDYSSMDSSGPNIIAIILYTVAMFFSYFTHAIMLVLCAFNFLGHEEKQEGKGLFSQIDEIK